MRNSRPSCRYVHTSHNVSCAYSRITYLNSYTFVHTHTHTHTYTCTPIHTHTYTHAHTHTHTHTIVQHHVSGTSLQVLIHDPLYLWTISPLKALSLQRQPEGEETAATHRGGGGEMVEGDQTVGANSCGSSNKMAERVLLRLQEKLEGIEDGVPLGISGQVNHLIQEATDITNLCQLFPGWQPWI